jgi:hypothetical protein
MTHSAKDHALAIIKAGINLIPMVGGPIASLIGDYVPTSTQAVIERSTELLAQKLDALKDRIDLEAVNKDDFSELFKSCYLVIVRTNREQKLQVATAILANLLLRPGDPAKSSYEELDHLIRCIDALSIGAITVLGAARTIAATSGQGAQRSFQFDRSGNRASCASGAPVVGARIKRRHGAERPRYSRPPTRLSASPVRETGLPVLN